MSATKSMPRNNRYETDGNNRSIIPVRRFDITDIGGKEAIPQIKEKFLRMYNPAGKDPLKNDWTPVLKTDVAGKVHCITTSKGMVSILENMGATRVRASEEGKILAVVC